MPPEEVEIVEPPPSLEKGVRIIFNVKIFGFVPVKWIAEHTAYDPPHMFEDVQVSGPFSRWRHRHMFIPHENGTVLRDEIEFDPPLWPLGEIGAPVFVLPNIRKLFDRHHKVTKEWCEGDEDLDHDQEEVK